MCGRFSLYKISEFLNEYNVRFDEPLKPRYNIAPGQMVPIIADGGKVAKWGFVPHWADEPKISPINTRKESLAKRFFKDSYEKRRCLVPADGFYEWKKVDGSKIPYRLVLDRDVFCFAGIYDIWKDTITFSIITVEPNDVIRPIHDRMPAILAKKQEEAWLSDGSMDLLSAYPGKMNAFRISDRVNSPLNDDPSVIEDKKGLSDFF